MESRVSKDEITSEAPRSPTIEKHSSLSARKQRTISFFQRHESVDLNSFASLSVVDMEPTSIKCGFLFKRGGGKRSSAWKRRFFLLTGQHLLYYKSDKEKKPQGVITPLRSFEFVDEEDDTKNRQFHFRLIPKKEGRPYVIYAASKEEKDDWSEILDRACSGANYTKAALQIEFQLKKNSYDIPAKDLEWNTTSALLGKGASGMVKKGLWLKTTEVAIKALNNLPELTDENEMTLFMKEIETLSTLRHPNIVPMFGYCRKDGYICLVTEFVKGGDLYSAIHNDEIHLSMHLKANLMSSIVCGMVYLYSKQIIHCYLKPHNILVENLEEARVKVCDFGLSTITRNEQGQQEKIFGSVAYAAPELPTPLHTSKVDVFSFAVIMWEIFSREKPWIAKTHTMQIVEGVASGERLVIPSPCPFSDLITRCWDGDPLKRPTFNEIYEELEPIKGGIESIQDYGNMSLANRQMPKDDPPEERIGKVFRDQPSVTWFEFQESLHEVFALSIDSIDRLKYVIANGEIVERERWNQFAKWFSPLVKVDYYQTSTSGTEQLQGFQVEDVVDMVGHPWFFGFLTANEAKDILQVMPPGSFLFRFSSNPGCYALSVNYGQVGHWRITTEKFGVSYPVFKIDGRSYRSMHEIIEVHGMGNEPLEIKSSSSIKSCFLKIPADRANNSNNNNGKRIYESFE